MLDVTGMPGVIMFDSLRLRANAHIVNIAIIKAKANNRDKVLFMDSTSFRIWISLCIYDFMLNYNKKTNKGQYIVVILQTF